MAGRFFATEPPRKPQQFDRTQIYYLTVSVSQDSLCVKVLHKVVITPMAVVSSAVSAVEEAAPNWTHAAVDRIQSIEDCWTENLSWN